MIKYLENGEKIFVVKKVEDGYLYQFYNDDKETCYFASKIYDQNPKNKIV